MIEREITTKNEAKNFLEKLAYQISTLRNFEDELEEKEFLLDKYKKIKEYSRIKFKIDTRKYDNLINTLENEKYNFIN